MSTLTVKDKQTARKLVEQRRLRHVKVGIFDIDGVLRGKYMSAKKFCASLDKGFGFCDVILGWDIRDQLYDRATYTGWHTGYPDANVRILPETCRELPLEDDMLFFLGEFSGAAEALCPRGVLRRVLQRAAGLGLEIVSGFEYEFFVFDETPQSIQRKHYQNLQPFTPGEFGYSVLRNSAESELYQALLQLAETMDFPLEGLHEETGPGVLEAALACDRGIASADKAALFKTFTKIALQKHDKMATFMAKWSPDYPGQSGHLHLSITDSKGQALFHDPGQADNISPAMHHFAAGLQRKMPEFLALVAPTINSYRRLVPGFWAPTHASVGIDNRTCAIRLIPGSAASQRLEYRIGAADANPYLVLAAVVASGLWGLEHQATIEQLVDGNAYVQDFPEHLSLPQTLWEAAQRLRQSDTARDYLGQEFVEHFASTREWEEREFRKAITQWELERYFEII